MGIAELDHLCLIRKKRKKENPPKTKKQNTHKSPTFALTLQIISEIQVILDGLLNKLHISVSVHIS